MVDASCKYRTKIESGNILRVMDNQRTFLCDVCSKGFVSFKGRNHHVKKCHSDLMYECYTCKYTSKYKASIARHMKVHLEGVGSAGRRAYPCVLCPAETPYQCGQRRSMLLHYSETHGVSLSPKTLELKSIRSFMEWKVRFEKENQCYFVASRGKSVSRDICTRKFRCFRDGFYSSKGVGKRRLKLVGSLKIGGLCPASISACEDLTNGIVHVSYVDVHVGHGQEISRLSLARETKVEIARKIAAKVPFNAILQNISVESEIDRVNLVTRKDLWNIAKSFNLLKNVTRSSNSGVDDALLADETRNDIGASSFNFISEVPDRTTNGDEITQRGSPDPPLDESSGSVEFIISSPSGNSTISKVQNLHSTTSNCELNKRKEKLRHLFEDVLEVVSCESHADIIENILRSGLTEIRGFN